MPKMTVTTNDGRFVADFEIGDVDPVDYQPEIDEVLREAFELEGDADPGLAPARRRRPRDPLDLNDSASETDAPMGERSWARLTIGGTVSRAALAGALESAGGTSAGELSRGRPRGRRGSRGVVGWVLGAGGVARGPRDSRSTSRARRAQASGPTCSSTSVPGGAAWSSSRDDSHAEPVIARSALADGAEPLPDPEGLPRVARAHVPGGPGPRTDQVGARSEGRRRIDGCALRIRRGCRPPPVEVTFMRTLSDTEALDRIHACLTGLEWSADTLEAIAALVDATGRPIAPPPQTIDDEPHTGARAGGRPRGPRPPPTAPRSTRPCSTRTGSSPATAPRGSTCGRAGRGAVATPEPPRVRSPIVLAGRVAVQRAAGLTAHPRGADRDQPPDGSPAPPVRRVLTVAATARRSSRFRARGRSRRAYIRPEPDR